MRVLHLTTEYPPVIYGGLGTAVGGWVAASARAGLSVAVLLVGGPLVVDGERYGLGAAAVLGTPGREVRDRLGVRFLPTTWERAVGDGLSLIERFRPHVLHLHTSMLWPLARTLRDLSGVPLVYHVHSVDRAEYEVGEEPSPWLVRTDQVAAIEAADRLIAISGSERALLANYYPEAESKVRVVGNGIGQADPACAGARRRRCPAEAPLVLYSGRLVERKGIRDLLAAVPAVLEKAPETRFVLAGGPPGCSGEQLAALWLPAGLTACFERVHFTGWLSPAELAGWYERADVLVVPSRYEPFGMVVLEGMLHGLAVAAADVGGPGEILADGRTGLLFPPRDAGALARVVLCLVREPELRLRLGRAARAEALSRWSWPRRVHEMDRVYAELALPRAA